MNFLLKSGIVLDRLGIVLEGFGSSFVGKLFNEYVTPGGIQILYEIKTPNVPEDARATTEKKTITDLIEKFF